MLRPLLFSICAMAGLSAVAQDRCTAHTITERWLQAHGRSADLRAAVDHAARGNSRGGSGTLNIPVAVHVVYNNSAENVSDGVIQGMLAQMNADYQGLNDDFNDVRATFTNARGVANINFCLAAVDPNGVATTGITRTTTTETWFDPDHETDDMKSAPLGIAPWDPQRYLNIWICDISSGATGNLVTAGYAYLPYGGMVGSAIDGLVVDYLYGIGASSDGRTATHEVGHYLGLLHPWGDGTCNNGDGINDTPNTDEPTFVCTNTALMHCSVLTQYENFMDYADCSMMFTDDQVALMQGTLTGVRSGLLTSTACTGSTGPCTITSANGTADGDYIDGVVLEDINNTASGAGATYQDLTATYSTALARGGTYSLFITGGTYSPDHYAAWIDLDGDGTYESNEKVGEFASSAPGQTGQFDLTMPANATLGATTMRVRGVYNGTDASTTTDPCTSYDYGETEDYGIVVTSTSGCVPTSANGTADGDFIDGVQLGGIINNGSGAVDGPSYTDYSEVVGTALALGQAYTIYITGGTYAPDHYAAWIDYNADGNYAANEKLGEFASASAGETGAFNFTVPVGATLGTTTLRVRGVYNGTTSTTQTDPCLSYDYGETEDYRIDIIGDGPVDCIPTASNGTSDGDYIDGVQLGGIVNTGSGSVSGPTYTDYTGQFGTALSVSTTYTLTVTTGDYTPDHYAAWIDYNADGAFGVDEKLGEFVTTGTHQTGTITFSVPAGAVAGNTVMRVRGVYTGTDNTVTVDPCFSYPYGETEDYRIVITNNGGACEPFSLNGTTDGDFVDGVVLEDINNTGSGAVGAPTYTDFSAQHSTALGRGNNYSVTITSGTYTTDHYAAWIDFDHDNTFELAEKLGEFITSAPGQTQDISFTVPNAATLGATLMRVRGAYILNGETSPLSPCFEYAYAETEDYGITIELSTGIDDVSGQALGVIRNGDLATITWTRTCKDQRLTVIDAAGRIVTDARPGTNRFEFPMGGLSSGIYQVVVLVDGQRLVGRLPQVAGE